MSKAQLTTALRRSFGDSVIKSDGAIGRLFDSFDFKRTDEMDWRAFLYMLSMLMQPYLYCDALLRYYTPAVLFCAYHCIQSHCFHRVSTVHKQTSVPFCTSICSFI